MRRGGFRKPDRRGLSSEIFGIISFVWWMGLMVFVWGGSIKPGFFFCFFVFAKRYDMYVRWRCLYINRYIDKNISLC